LDSAAARGWHGGMRNSACPRAFLRPRGTALSTICNILRLQCILI
jgi:hypothetical protein